MENREITTEAARLPEITTVQLASCPPEIAQAVTQMAQVMRGMADMLRTTNERIGSMEREIRLLTKVTPAQVATINAAVRTRAVQLCAAYRAAGCEQAAANAIRRAVKITTGVKAMRDLPRCEYDVAMQQVEIWDDYKAMKAIKNKGR